MHKKIVLLGDSMIDTFDFMGQEFPELKQKLCKLIPNSIVDFKNHGVGSTDVALGLERITKSYFYKERGRELPAVIDENPDVIVVESFAYNHWSNSKNDLDRYIECHKKIIKKIVILTKAKVLLTTSIAPNKEKFAEGVLSLKWSKEKQQREYALVIKYFKEFISYANQTGLPFLDLFSPSLNEENTGNLKYISNVDYIHLSYEGRTFTAQRMANEIAKLLV